MRLHVERDFHPRQAYLGKLLRYILGGVRPRQTTRQALSRFPDSRKLIRINITKGWYFTGVLPCGKTPTYSKHLKR